MSPGGRGRPHADPYLAGLGLGLVLLGALVVTGRGLGASGAYGTAAAVLARLVAREAAEASPVLARALAAGAPWRDWLVVEVAFAMLGGWASAALGGRLGREVERGAGIGRGVRLALAAAGGAAMGVGAVLARGCTSGLALTGGALLGVGPWLFMLTTFAGAYLVTPALRRWWR